VKSSAIAVLILIAVAAAVAQRTFPSDRLLTSGGQSIHVVTVARGLSHPWSLAFLPDGGMLVTERPGRLRVIRGGTLSPQPIAGVPEVRARSQGGLFDVVLHPRFAENRLVYLTYAKPGPRGATTAIARGRFEGSSLSGVQDIFVADAWADTNMHYGGRLAFARDGLMYLTVGERNQRRRAQTLRDHAGKVLRLRDDGSVPPDNPFAKSAAARPEIFSYGHRNMQGLAVHPETGAVWLTEHGPRGGDELNLVQAGHNYGWPVITYGREYSGEIITNNPVREGMDQPVTYWVPSIATSGLAFYRGDRLRGWNSDAFVGGLTGEQLARVVLEPGAAPRREPLLRELGARIRDVRQGPDGALYVVTDEDPGAVLRLEPAGSG
jgi:glucose/arabinose dehydrogenase